MTGEIFAKHWASFLVNRDYVLSLNDKNTDLPVRYKLRYAVGQPMGAYSSWALLALTHHFIVQFAAYKAGYRGWFTKYAILGDDVVIGDAKVAKAYLEVMRTLGVGIGLHKSLLSGSGSALEFAKRTIFKGVDVSPVPINEFKAALVAPSAMKLFAEKYKLTLSGAVKTLGYKFNVLGGLHKALGKLNSKVRLLILALNIPYEVSEVERFFELGLPKSGKALFETQAVINQMVDKEFKLIKAALNKVRFALHSLEGKHLNAKDIAKVMLGRVKGPPVGTTTVELLLDACRSCLPALKPDAAMSYHKALSEYRLEATWNAGLYQTAEALLAEFDQSKFGLSSAESNVLDPEVTRDSGTFAGFDYDVTAPSYLRVVLEVYQAEALRGIIPMVKAIALVTQFDVQVRTAAVAEQLSSELVAVMLAKYEKTASEMYMSLIALSKSLGALPLASLKYTRVIDPKERGLTDGMHVRLWKSLGGLAQGTAKMSKDRIQSERVFTGWNL